MSPRVRQRLHFCPQVHSLRFFAVSVLRSSALDLHLSGSLSKKPCLSFCVARMCTLQPQHLAEYDLDKLRCGVLPKDVVDLVSPSLAEVLRHPCSSLNQSPAELLHFEESERPITPYWDPTLRRESRQRAERFHKLADLKILSFRARACAFAGLFFVKKKPHRRCPTS